MPNGLIALIFILSTWGQTKSPTLDTPAAINKVRYATVRIAAVGQGQHRGLGSGFLVTSSGFVITNKHVADAISSGEVLIVEFRIPNKTFNNSSINAGFVGNAAQTIDVDGDNDLALIKTTVPTGLVYAIQFDDKSPKAAPVTVVRLSKKMPQEGEKIIVSGFPLNLSTLESQESIVASQTFRFTVGPSPYLGDSHSDLLLVSVPISHGNSGGPVYSSTTGQVVGVAEGFKRAAQP